MAFWKHNFNPLQLSDNVSEVVEILKGWQFIMKPFIFCQTVNKICAICTMQQESCCRIDNNFLLCMPNGWCNWHREERNKKMILVTPFRQPTWVESQVIQPSLYWCLIKFILHHQPIKHSNYHRLQYYTKFLELYSTWSRCTRGSKKWNYAFWYV